MIGCAPGTPPGITGIGCWEEAGGGGRDGDPIATLILSFKSSNAVLVPATGCPDAGGGGLGGGGAIPARKFLASSLSPDRPLRSPTSSPVNGIVPEGGIDPSEAA